MDVEQINFFSENLIGEPVERWTQSGQPMYKKDDPSDIYRYKPQIELLTQTLFKDQKVILRGVYLNNGKNGRSFRSGFLDNEILARRLIDDNGKWQQKNNCKPYTLLTPARYHFTSRDEGLVYLNSDPGTILWMPSGCELKISDNKKREIVMKIMSGL